MAIALLGAAKFDPIAAEQARQDSINYQAVSLVALLGNPAAYDGKRVQASGYLTLNFEDHGLHLDKAAYDAGLRKNAVFVEHPDWLSRKEAARLSNRYATVFGVFHAHDTGHYGLYSGSMGSIRRISPGETAAEFQAYMNRSRDSAFWMMVSRPGLLLVLFIAGVTTVLVRLILRRMTSA